jgi:hypothetical protein
MHWRIRQFTDWLRRPFRPKGWCDRCRCVHIDFPDEPSIGTQLTQKMADQIADEIEREILDELFDLDQEMKNMESK